MAENWTPPRVEFKASVFREDIPSSPSPPFCLKLGSLSGDPACLKRARRGAGGASFGAEGQVAGSSDEGVDCERLRKLAGFPRPKGLVQRVK